MGRAFTGRLKRLRASASGYIYQSKLLPTDFIFIKIRVLFMFVLEVDPCLVDGLLNLGLVGCYFLHLRHLLIAIKFISSLFILYFNSFEVRQC